MNQKNNVTDEQAERLKVLSRTNTVHMQDIYKSYGKHLVLDNIDLSIGSGEFVCLVGPSGCGKSTLLRLILGQELPDSGTFLIEGEPAGLVDERRGIVYQQYSLYRHLTVLENVALGKQLTTPIWRRPFVRKDIKEAAMFHLDNMGLADSINKYPYELSGGMRQRVAIAQSLIMNPKILLMDEPFGALDPGSRERMQVFLLSLWEKFRMTVIFVTHDLDEAVYLGTRIAVLCQYYTDGRGNEFKRGAKIIIARPLPRHALSTEVKSAPEFNSMVTYIRDNGFRPSNRVHISEFNLQHPNSFHTLTAEEMKK